MSKGIIAVDVDDVLANTTGALRVAVNQATGLHLTEDDYRVPAPYWGFYEHVWSQAGIQDHSHIHAFHEQLAVNQDNIQPVADSQEVLAYLIKDWDIVAITSRELFMETETIKWLHKKFPNVFKDIVLLGHVNTALQTKGEACLATGANYLIDDNIAHCESAISVGVSAILFGDYGWQHDFDNSMPRAKDWQAVKAYFDAKLAG